MDSNLLQVLVCPLCKGPLQHDHANHELICKADRLAYPVRDGIPVMLENEARDLNNPNAAGNLNAAGNPPVSSEPAPKNESSSGSNTNASNS